jgi:hypothetical protein
MCSKTSPVPDASATDGRFKGATAFGIKTVNLTTFSIAILRIMTSA